MALLRVILLTLLMFAALPWGAYAGARQHGGPAMADMAAPVLLAEHAERVLVGLHRCRTALLPGARCHPELVLPAADLPPPPTGQHAAALLLHGSWRSGIMPPVLKKPPRLG